MDVNTLKLSLGFPLIGITEMFNYIIKILISDLAFVSLIPYLSNNAITSGPKIMFKIIRAKHSSTDGPKKPLL